MKLKLLLLPILLLFFLTSIFSQQDGMDKFIGINIHKSDPVSKMDVAGVVREYHEWAADEGNYYDTQYSFTSGGIGIDDGESQGSRVIGKLHFGKHLLKIYRDDGDDDPDNDVIDEYYFYIKQQGDDTQRSFELVSGGHYDVVAYNYQDDIPYSFQPDGHRILEGSVTIRINRGTTNGTEKYFLKWSKTLNEPYYDVDKPYNQYKWNSGWNNRSVRFDDFFTEINDVGCEVDASLMFCLPWISGAYGKTLGQTDVFQPVHSNWSGGISGGWTGFDDDTEEPQSYFRYADWVHNFSARYGDKEASDYTKLKFFDQEELLRSDVMNSGMGIVQYVEIWNEQNRTWNYPKEATNFTPKEYAAMASAAYDGLTGKTQIGDTYDMGFNEVTNNTKYVMGGLSKIDWIYLERMRAWYVDNNKPFPFDVLNFHFYAAKYHDFLSNQIGNPNQEGVSPESYLMNHMPKLVDVPPAPADPQYFPSDEPQHLKRYLQDMKSVIDDSGSGYPSGVELWISEFGYDTGSSPIQVPEIKDGETVLADRQEVQGEWLIRSYLEIAAAGWNKAFMYFFSDNNTNIAPNTPFPGGLFETSGLLLDKNHNYQPKKSYYYTNTTKEVLSGLKFGHEYSEEPYSTAPDKPRVMLFEQHPDGTPETGDVFAVWLPSSEGAEMDYVLDLLGSFPKATVIEMRPGDEDGFHTGYEITDPHNFSVTISERPIYVKVGEFIFDSPVPCVSEITTKSISCDAIELSWTNNAAYDHFQVWYYEKNDSEESGTPNFNMGDINWKLFTDHYPGNKTNIVVNGLKKPHDTYYFYVEAISIQGAQSDDCGVVSGETALCDAGYITSNHFEISYPGQNNEIDNMFDYSDVRFCAEQYDYAIQNIQDVNVPVTMTFKDDAGQTTAYLVDAISVYDVNSDGDFVVSASTSDSGDDFVEIAEFYTQFYHEWKSFSLNGVNAKRLRFNFNGSGKVAKIIIYGRPNGENYGIPNCCQPEGTIVIGTDINSVTSLHDLAVLPPGPVQDMVFQVNGKLIIDNYLNDYRFQGCQFIAMEGASIEVPTRLFTQNTTFEGCEEMWEGIRIDGDVIVMDNTTIRDAVTGIKFLEPWQNYAWTQLTLRNSFLEKNFIGISKSTGFNPEFLPGVYLYNVIIDGTRNDLKPLYTGAPAEFVGHDKSIDGVRAGFLNIHSFKSLFQNLERGISTGSPQSGIGIYGSNFRDIEGSYPFGYGIRTIGNLRVGKMNGTVTRFNDIIGFGAAIYHMGKFDIRDVSAHNIYHGIITKGGGVVLNSTIFPESTGIASFSQYNVSIKNNEINSHYPHTGGHGIFATGVWGSGYISIFGNKVELFDAGHGREGIDVMGLKYKGGYVHDNEVSMYGWGDTEHTRGIGINHSDGIVLFYNKVKGLEENKHASFTGIGINYSPMSKIFCNAMDDSKFGMVVTGDCSSMNGVAGNAFRNHYQGLVLKEGGILGSQIHIGNTWEDVYDHGSPNSVAAINYNDFSNFDDTPSDREEFSIFTMNEDHYPGDDNVKVGSDGDLVSQADAGRLWFRVDNEAQDYTCVPPPPEVPGETKKKARTKLLTKGLYYFYAANPGIDFGLTDADKWTLERHIYQAIKEEYPTGNYGTPFSDFIADRRGTSIEYFYHIDKAIEDMLNQDSILMEEYQMLQKQVDALNGPTENMLPLVFDMSFEKMIDFFSNDKNFPKYKGKLERMAEIDSIILADRILTAENIKVSKDYLNSPIVYESYEAKVDEIFLSTIAINNDSLTHDQMELVAKIIAPACPSEAGESVFKARALVAELIDLNTHPEWDDNCSGNNSRRGVFEKKIVEKKRLRVVPNPASYEVYFNSDQQDVDWFLSTASGKKAMFGRTNKGINVIDTGILRKGIYFLTVLYDEPVTVKVIIQ